jgi:hypothetical protein
VVVNNRGGDGGRMRVRLAVFPSYARTDRAQQTAASALVKNTPIIEQSNEALKYGKETI